MQGLSRPGTPPPGLRTGLTFIVGQDAPEIHLSYHDGAHYNSVRRADDFANGAPAPITLGTSKPARAAEHAYGVREEERVAQEAGCFHDRAAVRAALDAAGGRVAQVLPMDDCVWQAHCVLLQSAVWCSEGQSHFNPRWRSSTELHRNCDTGASLSVLLLGHFR